jgi:soluble lytic murein transglycosylase-like protein
MALGDTRQRIVEQAGITESVFNAHSQNVPPEILYAMIKKESAFDRYAVRFEPNYRWTYEVEKFAKKNRVSYDTELAFQSMSAGPMQIMLANVRSMGYEGPFPLIIGKPTNLFSYGASFLYSLFQKYGNWPDAISAYNQGSPRRKKFSTKYKNQDYVDDVMNFARLAGYVCPIS